MSTGEHKCNREFRDLLVQNGYIVVYYGFPIIFEASTKDMAILDASAHAKYVRSTKSTVMVISSAFTIMTNQAL